MATKEQQYTGRLYTQAEVDRMVREARVKELKRIEPPEVWEDYARIAGSEHCIVCGFNAIKFRGYIADRIAELSKEDV